MKQHAPATIRNRNVIYMALREVLPESGTLLEIAAGTGEHAAYLSGCFSKWNWIPSDANPAALASIGAWREDCKHSNLQTERVLDVCVMPWDVPALDAILCVNMVHISPWESSKALFRGCMDNLATGCPLILYGPYFSNDPHAPPPAPSNEAFDSSLRARDPEWGVRNIEDMDALAKDVGMKRTSKASVPANNLILVYRKE